MAKERGGRVRLFKQGDKLKRRKFQDETRSIPPSVQNLLWGMAAGRCEFEGCNSRLWKNDLTQDERALGQKAHIIAFSARGPRGRAETRNGEVNAIENLMLLCPICHITIDRRDGPAKYTVERLRAMKKAHEARVDSACSVAADRVSHVLTYGSHVGAHHAMPALQDARLALMTRNRYPGSTTLDLSTRDGADTTIELDFWERENERLTRQFDRQVRQRVEAGEIRHVSVFALAPQPLLIRLGTMLGDICPVDTYQRHREPPTWEWASQSQLTEFGIRAPESTNGPAALVLAISATITRDRIERVLGAHASIWSVTVAAPHNDVVKSAATLGAFRAAMRPVLDRIKAAHGHQTTLHVFPAMPVSVAVELGRVRMPKADMPWRIYDEQSARGGFVPTITISGA